MKSKRTGGSMPALALSAALVACAGAALAAPGDGEEKAEVVKKIRVQKMAECEGENCPDTPHVIIKKIGPDGVVEENVHPMGSHGKGCPCMMGGATRSMVFVGEGGDIDDVHSLGGHEIEWHSEKCEGDECEDARRIVIKTTGGEHGHHLMHALASHHHGSMAAGKGGFLGVQLTDLTPELRRHFGVSGESGVMIAKVLVGSAAEAAALAVGDIVVAAAGEAVASGSELATVIGAREPGEEVALEVWSGGSSAVRQVILGESRDARKAERRMRRVLVACEDGGEECEVDVDGVEVAAACGDGEECEIEVRCDEDDECTCTVNGAAADCAELGVPHPAGS